MRVPRRGLPAFSAIGEERRRERPHCRDRRRCAAHLGISKHRPNRQASRETLRHPRRRNPRAVSACLPYWRAQLRPRPHDARAQAICHPRQRRRYDHPGGARRGPQAHRQLRRHREEGRRAEDASAANGSLRRRVIRPPGPAREAPVRPCRAKVRRSPAGSSGTTGIAPRQATPTLARTVHKAAGRPTTAKSEVRPMPTSCFLYCRPEAARRFGTRSRKCAAGAAAQAPLGPNARPATVCSARSLGWPGSGLTTPFGAWFSHATHFGTAAARAPRSAPGASRAGAMVISPRRPAGAPRSPRG